MIINSDSLEYLKQFNDYEFDINYSDPPYALGSEVIVRADGKVDYKKASDFMNKWEMPTGDYWKQWFKEAYRTLKHGGYLIMFGMDRQLLLFKYYANLAGFTEQQSLYWYFISNFPKATDLSKQIDKNARAERVGTGQVKKHSQKGVKVAEERDEVGAGAFGKERVEEITAPSTELAKKYEGYKYSISPLKQTNETILVFFKPTKTGSVLHDVLAKEKGDETISGNCIDIDGNRVGTETRINKTNVGRMQKIIQEMEFRPYTNGISNPDNKIIEVEGRYPSQTFVNSNAAEALDKQSGILKSGAKKSNQNQYNGNGKEFITNLGASVREYKKSEGGCSKILHKCDFEENEHDLYFYNPKVSKSERNAGCDGEEKQYSHDGRNKEIENPYQRNKSVAINNHPTLKPIKLNERILKLFKTPNEQKIIYPFAGSGSEIIGGIKAGFTNWVGCEINPDYVEIAKARIDYWTTSEKEIDKSQVSLFDLMEEEK
jgi:DNA modification methylase